MFSEDVPRMPPKADLNQELVQTLLSSDLLSLSVHEKSALIGRIVRSSGMQLWTLCY